MKDTCSTSLHTHHEAGPDYRGVGPFRTVLGGEIGDDDNMNPVKKKSSHWLHTGAVLGPQKWCADDRVVFGRAKGQVDALWWTLCHGLVHPEYPFFRFKWIFENNINNKREQPHHPLERGACLTRCPRSRLSAACLPRGSVKKGALAGHTIDSPTGPS